ncbi:MAG: hypothetical protein ABW024_09825 [Microbacterium sp.]
MTRFAIDAVTALRLIDDDRRIEPAHTLVAPARLRSEALSTLYRRVREGAMDERDGRARLERIAELKIRLLADRVSRATAWRLAAGLDWDDTARAEYLAVASLQADALVTDDPTLVDAADGVVPIADYEQIFTPARI